MIRCVPLCFLTIFSITSGCIPTVSPDDDDMYEEPTTSIMLQTVSSTMSATTSTAGTTTTTAGTSTTTAVCPSMWAYNSVTRACYIKLPGSTMYPDAVCQAENSNSHKASILNMDENDFIFNVLVTPDVDQYVYIGGTTSGNGAPGSWSWPDSSTYSYEHWQTTLAYPMVGGSCMLMSALGNSNDGFWVNFNCGNPNYAIICKAPV